MLELSQEVFKKNVEKALVKHMKDVSEFLMKKSPLQNLSDERLALLATKCMLFRYSQGCTLISKDQINEYIYIIKTGLVSIVKDLQNQPFSIIELSSGEVFGEEIVKG